LIEFRDVPNKGSAPRARKGKQQAVIEPKRKGKGRVADEEPIEDFNNGDMDDSYFQDVDDDDIVEDEPPSVPVSRRTTNAAPAVGPSRSAASAPVVHTTPVTRPTSTRPASIRPTSARSATTSSRDDLHAKHLDALRAWRGEMAAQENLDDEEVLSDEVLQMLVLMPPMDGIASVEAAFTNWIAPRSDNDRNDLVLKAHKYGPGILAIFATGKPSPSSFSRPPSAAPAPTAAPLPAAAPARVRSFKPVELHDRFDYRPNAASGSK
jgi:hypothetical protein